jgi:hypothetical protein|tara:strand:- start:489 stop:704 length:216 start_codon:yes stop_codon:yes gene_type:complete
MKFNLDVKTAITIGVLLFTIAGFYYTTVNDLNSLSLKISGLESENRIHQKRLDLLDKKTNRLKKKLEGINN